MMESIVGNIWSSRHLSTTGRAILNRASEEIQTLPLCRWPPHSWFNAGHRLEASSRNRTLLDDLVADILSNEMRGSSYGDDGELLERVLMALVLMQSERLPGTHLTCLMCPSQETDVQCSQDSPRVSMERHLVSSCGYWTLNVISIYPHLRDVDDQSPLCETHDILFDLALDAVLGYIDRPVR